MDPNLTDRLRQLAFNSGRFDEASGAPVQMAPCQLDSKSLALVQLAGLVAMGGAVPSFGSQADAAVAAGASDDEIVDVLVGLIPILGLPCVVAAAPRLALALGYDTEEAL